VSLFKVNIQSFLLYIGQPWQSRCLCAGGAGGYSAQSTLSRPGARQRLDVQLALLIDYERSVLCCERCT
jgi:hypothetical protein